MRTRYSSPTRIVPGSPRSLTKEANSVGDAVDQLLGREPRLADACPVAAVEHGSDAGVLLLDALALRPGGERGWSVRMCVARQT